MSRDRAFAAIIHEGKIVMVKMEEDKDNVYWTLPGGAVESGETFEEAAIREAQEEANIEIKIIRFLFERQYAAGTEYCYLALPLNGIDIKLGYDPELGINEQVLTKVEWKDIIEHKDDLHISRVLKALTCRELRSFNLKDGQR